MKPVDRRRLLDEAEEQVEEVQALYNAGNTAPHPWRVVHALQKLIKVLRAHEEEITK